MDAIAATTAASTQSHLAAYRLWKAFASWSHTRATSTVSTTTAMPMMTHRSHQYLPRVVPSWLRASFAGASTSYRVRVCPSDRRLRYRHGPHWICRLGSRRCGTAPDPQGGGVG